ncbi:MAG TPA: agmatine deiminase family protein [Candidatus Eisenbacteria bacterium]|nr:agmatine deiminase family protein [Candidatus Eisenbacteria bacterium]
MTRFRRNARAPAEPVTPRSLGYAMPAEWAPHRATWLAWPHNRETWPEALERVRDAWLAMIRALIPGEEVCLLVNDEPMRRDVEARLVHAGLPLDRIPLLVVPTVDVWTRDYGPTFVTRGEPLDPVALNDWIFNGWGNKYQGYDRDDGVARALAALLGLPVFEHDVVLEGGSIDVNGAGICLTTEQCLLNQNRNPALDRATIETFLGEALGVERVVWLGRGIAGDDTDGHIDDIARFVNPTTIACVVTEDPRDENYKALQENYERLQSARDAAGGRFSVVKLPSPEPVVHAGAALPASYANFYIANHAVLVPTFDDAADREALGILRELFPGRAVIGISCRAVVAGLGGIHCVTQQEPSAGPSRD